MKRTINIEDIVKMNSIRDEFNSIPFELIEWRLGGAPIRLDEHTIEHWKFTGLVNTDFIKFKLYEGRND